MEDLTFERLLFPIKIRCDASECLMERGPIKRPSIAAWREIHTGIKLCDRCKVFLQSRWDGDVFMVEPKDPTRRAETNQADPACFLYGTEFCDNECLQVGCIMKIQRPQTGFTLIELLIVIAIIGILAAISIPNLISAVQRGKQKRTMADMRAIATAIEAYAVDNNVYPAATCPEGAFTTYGTDLYETASLKAELSPQYIQKLPVIDGWGFPFKYNVINAGQQYNIVSLGRDGVAGEVNCGTTTSFNDDIVYSNGAFLQWPEGTQK